jgi:hypothetical protein
MDHINEDKLLEFVLETLVNEAERAEIEGHLRSCPDCREKLAGLNGDIEAIGGIKGRFEMAEIYYPRKERLIGYAFLKAAALLILGFIGGLVVSGELHHEPVSISASYMKLSPPADSILGYTACDATEINPEYYAKLIETE